ncbi:SDR family oxidoreductase [Antribacter sp. KLBMP9083]|uniref:SDR family oxidoreductase n=1 Tax=Antribacter soli TaxID=2910976 RepID=A0AA41U7S3_9MICO|nr:SDR family oxidoreductase [Antribacter soli]MCF4121906.1 SDR family oxidoreductase [Antribacter soli]
MGEPLGTPVLVVGAGGFVGSRVARGLAAGGRPVLAASRGPLPDAGRSPGVHHCRYTDLASLPAAVQETCTAAGLALPGGVVASVGGWHKGPGLLELDPVVWRETLESHLTAHLLAARALVPLLAQARAQAQARAATGGPRPYIVLNGAASHEAMSGSGAISVTGAGLSMLVRVLRTEAAERGTPVRFHELVIDDAVAADDRNETPARTVDPARVVAALGEMLDRSDADAVVHLAGEPPA